MPPAVQERATHLANAWRDSLRRAAGETPSAAAGCRPTDYPNFLGPPAPKVDAAIIGHHVEVVARLDQLPTSLACRPLALVVSVSGEPVKGTNPMPAWTETRILRGPGAGRAVVRLPLYTRAPYTLRVSSGHNPEPREQTRQAHPPLPASGMPPGATRRPPTRPSSPRRHSRSARSPGRSSKRRSAKPPTRGRQRRPLPAAQSPLPHPHHLHPHVHRPALPGPALHDPILDRRRTDTGVLARHQARRTHRATLRRHRRTRPRSRLRHLAPLVRFGDS